MTIPDRQRQQIGLQGDIQRLSPGAKVDLFALDVSPIDPLVTEPFRWIPMTSEDQEAVAFRGFVYQPMPIQVTGFAVSSRGSLPRPKLRVANVQGLVSDLLAQYDDFRGAFLHRTRTFEKYLDGGEQADPLASVAEDVWRVQQKTRESLVDVEFELGTSLDWQGQRIPRRSIYHNACPWIYEGAVLGRKENECPYAHGGNGTQTNMFDVNDNPVVDPDDDRCGKRVSSCELRFGEGNALPFGSMPGANRVLR